MILFPHMSISLYHSLGEYIPHYRELGEKKIRLSTLGNKCMGLGLIENGPLEWPFLLWGNGFGPCWGSRERESMREGYR